MNHPQNRKGSRADDRPSRWAWLVIALLLVLALAALQTFRWTAEARRIAAAGAIAQAKGLCSQACSEWLVTAAGRSEALTGEAIIERLGSNPSIDPDIRVTLHPAQHRIRIEVTEVDGVPIDLEGAFDLPPG